VQANRPVQDDFTIEAWINTSSPGLAGTQFFQGAGLVYADKAGVDNDWGAAILNGKFAFGTGNPDSTVQSTTSVNTGTWVHVAAVRTQSTGTIRVYVNGVLENTLITSNTASLNAQPTMFIGGNVNDDRFYDGTIDEVRAWNVARDGAQITATMNQRLTGTEPGLVGYWRFDEGSNTVAHDSSPTHNDGTLINGPVWVTNTAPIN
jgi:hypothetical protein